MVSDVFLHDARMRTVLKSTSVSYVRQHDGVCFGVRGTHRVPKGRLPSSFASSPLTTTAASSPLPTSTSSTPNNTAFIASIIRKTTNAIDTIVPRTRI